MTRLIALLASATFGLSAAGVAAADFPQKGEATYDTYFVSENKATIDGQVGTGEIDILTGINRNVKGEGPFNDMSVVCLMHGTQIGSAWKHYASCVEIDESGDSFFTTSDESNHYFTGGTGKYKGIKGTIPYTVRQLHNTADGRLALIVTHRASWTIEK